MTARVTATLNQVLRGRTELERLATTSGILDGTALDYYIRLLRHLAGLKTTRGQAFPYPSKPGPLRHVEAEAIDAAAHRDLPALLAELAPPPASAAPPLPPEPLDPAARTRGRSWEEA